MAPPQGRKKSLGRKKIEMKPIADENARTVTFSKRRVGLFKKATELSVLCGTQIALIIFSLGGRAYSFGHPNVESVLSRFRSRNSNPNLQDTVHAMRMRSATLQQLKEQCDQKNKEIEAKKLRGKEIEVALEGSSCQISEERLNMLDLHQLKQLKEKMEKFRENLCRLANGTRSDSVKPSRSTLNDVGPSRPKKIHLANIEENRPRVSFIKPSHLKSDVIRHSDPNKSNLGNIEANEPLVNFIRPSHLRSDGIGYLDPNKVNLANIEANGPQVNFIKPSHLKSDVVGHSDSNKVNIVNVETNKSSMDFVKPSYISLDVDGPSISKKVNLTSIEANGSWVDFAKPSYLTLDINGPSANIKVNGSKVGFRKPSLLDVGGHSVAKKADMENIDANGLRVDFDKPLNLSLGVIRPSALKEVDLTNLEGDERDASPIPPNWLKL